MVARKKASSKSTPIRRNGARERVSDRSPALRYRAVRAVESHPWLTLTGVTSLATLWPIVLPVMAWLFGFIDTVPQARERENLMKAEILKSQTDIANTVAASVRQAAGLSLQGLYNATMM